MMQKVAAFITGLFAGLNAVRGLLILALVLGAAAYMLYRNPPFKPVGRGEVGLRANLFTGEITEQREGSVLVLPLMHDLRVFALRDQVYRPPTQRADGPSPVQSLEGLSLGADIAVRYAIDPARLRAVAGSLPDDIAGEIVEPAVQGVIYKTFARYTVREIFSTKRVEIQQAVETELRARFAADGLALRGVQIGKVDLPREYRRGMESLLAEELATEKMRYTLELKEKRVQEIALDGEAEKTRREKAAEAAAREQVLAAKAQEEAMRHVLPFKQRQIEQRTLEAEAEKAARITNAEASAQARRIE
ncbi:MAG TPA: SPFH domain-containing protein, partial [Burkholderiales bacterium]|nr:SPFH domain-containing protein [Burkholderiales bacterium]